MNNLKKTFLEKIQEFFMNIQEILSYWVKIEAGIKCGALIIVFRKFRKKGKC